jgi:PAS domain S-box-containing protein
MGIRDLEANERLQLLIDAVIDYAIYVIDLDGSIVSWNSGAERLKGYTAEEIIGRDFSVFFIPEDQKVDFPKFALDTARKEGRFESEGWRLRKDGNRFWALAVLDAIRNAQGEVIGFAKVTRDLTERREAEKRVKEAQEQLAVSHRMETVGQLTGGIAHDFNNLLMIVLGNLENAEKTAKSLSGSPLANHMRSITNAMRGAQRAAVLTHRLLAFSRRQPLNPKPLDVNRFLGQMVEFLERSLGEGVQIEAVGSGGLWQIEVDATQLETAILNLAINARDAMLGGGKLTLEAQNSYLDAHYRLTNPEVTSGQYVVICVTDTGSGMDDDVQSRAFEPFFTTKEPGHGTGLGLSQVYGFVKQSRGHVKIYSEAGQGTTVKMYFPRLISTTAADESDEVDGNPLEAEAGETILVVEDDNDLRSYLTETLRDLNYRVLAAAEATTAVGYLSQPGIRIDLLLTDVVMKGMNGRELAERAADLRPKLKVLFMTGYSRNAVVHHGRIDADVQLLQKPISQAQLSSRIRDALDG